MAVPACNKCLTKTYPKLHKYVDKNYRYDTTILNCVICNKAGHHICLPIWPGGRAKIYKQLLELKHCFNKYPQNFTLKDLEISEYWKQQDQAESINGPFIDLGLKEVEK